jgi:hypothetical protein
VDWQIKKIKEFRGILALAGPIRIGDSELAKVRVDGSNPFARSKFSNYFNWISAGRRRTVFSFALQRMLGGVSQATLTPPFGAS